MSPTHKILAAFGYVRVVARSGQVAYKLPVYRRLVNSHTEAN